MVYHCRTNSNIEEDYKECVGLKACDADCKLGDWTSWSSCSVTCLNTTRHNFPTRTRTRSKVKNAIGMGMCQHLEEKEYSCPNLTPCPIDHYYRDWTPWSDCPKCVNTAESNPKRKRTRRCIDGKHGGSECPSIFR